MDPSQREALPKAGFLNFWSWVGGRLERFEVAGDSMLPTLESGWVVLVNRRAYTDKAPEAGDIVLAEFPGASTQPVIKRVRSSCPEGFDLRGDNPAQSDDSVTRGLVSRNGILGQVICTFP